MSYNRMVLLILLLGLFAPWSELRHVSHTEDAFIPRRCVHPPKPGKCKQASLRYYYDVQRKRCEIFVYKGCEASENNFLNLQDCLHACHLFVEMAQRYQPDTVPKKCTLPKVGGRCRAAFPNFYYNTETKKCERFIYGGCGGNANRFENIHDCIEDCQRFGEDPIGFGEH